MSEEEIIRNVKRIIELSDEEKKTYDNLIMLKYFLQEEGDENWEKYCEAIETLLTAYEKEKEENMSYYYHIKGLEDDIRMHYISTYKIEKEIKRIKDSNTYGYVGEEWNDRDVVELLENLISKEK